MEKYMGEIKQNVLFRGIDEDFIYKIAKISAFKLYGKNIQMYNRHEFCRKIGIIVHGNISLFRHTERGNEKLLTNLKQGDIFGESLMYSASECFPLNIRSNEETLIMYISEENLTKLFSHNLTFLKNFLQLLSEKIIFLTDKINIVSLDTIREKLMYYLKDVSVKQKNKRVVIDFNREQLANYLNTTRPSLSRELANMKKDGLIDYNKNRFTIKF